MCSGRIRPRNLSRLEPLSKSGRLLVRNPKSDDGDMVITNDNLDDVIDALERLKLKEAL